MAAKHSLGPLLFLHSPMRSQVAARVPGGGGGWRADALVVILHLQADGPPQTPRDVQQPLNDELAFLLHRAERWASLLPPTQILKDALGRNSVNWMGGGL